MSGGAFDYIYGRVAEAADYAEDLEIKDLLNDLADLLYEEEWYESGDTNKEKYIKCLNKFKEKWFGSSRELRLRGYIDEELEKTKISLYNLIGEKVKTK